MKSTKGCPDETREKQLKQHTGFRLEKKLRSKKTEKLQGQNMGQGQIEHISKEAVL